MIKFFRKIRQNLLLEGKSGKYFKYALGEIFLVMVGILLALQVNNWNLKNKERTDQLTQLAKLRIEIEAMQEFLRIQIGSLETAKEGTKPLLELMGPNASMKILPDSINKLFRKAVNTDFVTAEKLSFETQINFESIQQRNYGQLNRILSSWKHFSGRIAADFALIEANREVGLENALINSGVPGFAVLYKNDQRLKFPIDYESMLQSHEVFAKLYHRNFRMSLLIHDLKGGLDQLDQMLNEIINN
tara:strand:+ start:701 stop:1438 length:738 start_codon:yes stop_codon:yes gene_type:complete